MRKKTKRGEKAAKRRTKAPLSAILDSGKPSLYNAPRSHIYFEGVRPTLSSWAQVAQLVEHCTENAGVGGSIPPLGTTLKFLKKYLCTVSSCSPGLTA